jgi:hypothetical protein
MLHMIVCDCQDLSIVVEVNDVYMWVAGSRQVRQWERHDLLAPFLSREVTTLV